ncbi:MAG: PqiC family protein [Planctomycetota bacterium]
MKNAIPTTRRATGPMALIALAALAAGCLSRSPEPRTFTLGGTPPVAGEDRASSVAVQIGPLRFPRYLERPQFVRRVRGGELDLDESVRWADSFEENVLRALRLDIERRLDSNRIFDHTQDPPVQLDQRALVDFDELVVGPDDVLRMRARWTVLALPGGPRTLARADLDVPLRDGSIEARVEAHEQAIEALGAAIAGEIARRDAAGAAEADE